MLKGQRMWLTCPRQGLNPICLNYDQILSWMTIFAKTVEHLCCKHRCFAVVVPATTVDDMLYIKLVMKDKTHSCCLCWSCRHYTVCGSNTDSNYVLFMTTIIYLSMAPTQTAKRVIHDNICHPRIFVDTAKTAIQDNFYLYNFKAHSSKYHLHPSEQWPAQCTVHHRPRWTLT